MANYDKNSLAIIQQHRLLDWLDDGDKLQRDFELAAAIYRQKICKNCDSTQRCIRKCIQRDEKDILGNDYTVCEHLNKAIHSKLRNKIQSHVDFHPLFQKQKLFELNDEIIKL